MIIFMRMKVYSISKWAFYAISLLILALPVSRHWKLIATGGRAEGTVTGYVLRPREVMGGEVVLYHASRIEFVADGKSCIAYGPADFEYKEGAG